MSLISRFLNTRLTCRRGDNRSHHATRGFRFDGRSRSRGDRNGCRTRHWKRTSCCCVSGGFWWREVGRACGPRISASSCSACCPRGSFSCSAHRGAAPGNGPDAALGIFPPAGALRGRREASQVAELETMGRRRGHSRSCPSPWTAPFGVAWRPFRFRCQIAARCAVSVDWVA